MAILEDLRLRQVKTMATTHYQNSRPMVSRQPLCKMPAWFDTATLRPTYRFMQGVPGRSNAFEIAKRLGLSEVIVGDASPAGWSGQWCQSYWAAGRADAREPQTLGQYPWGGARKSQDEPCSQKLYNELNREKGNELNKAREQAAEIVDMALSESDRFLRISMVKSQLKPHWNHWSQGQIEKLAPEKVGFV